MEHSLSKERKPSPTKHHSFDELYSRHLTLCLAIAVNECQSGQVELQQENELLYGKLATH